MKKVLFFMMILVGLASCGFGAKEHNCCDQCHAQQAIDSTQVDSLATPVDTLAVDSTSN